MEFNQLISAKLHYLFAEHGLEITEQSSNIVKYDSAMLHISLIHNPKENSNILWVGRRNFNEVEIDDHVMREYFSSNLKLSNLSQETFVNNVFLFFIGDGEKLLKKNEHALISLEKFNEQRSREYSANLVKKQDLEAADKAWTNGNYSEVIKYLEKVNTEDLPESFRQKYKIARQRLEK